MKKLLLGMVIAMSMTGVAYSCFKTKQCCKRDYSGNLQCITKCDYERCDYSHPIEIK